MYQYQINCVTKTWEDAKMPLLLKRPTSLLAGLSIVLMFTLLIACGTTSDVEARVADLEAQIKSQPIPTLAEVPKSDLPDSGTTVIADQTHEDDHAHEADDVDYIPDVSFTLQTMIGNGGMAYIGVGGDIDDIINPTLNVAVGDTVQITVQNGDGAEHNIVVPDLDAHSEHIVGVGASVSITFVAEVAGGYAYFCSIPGHRAAGMEGLIRVGEGTEEQVSTAVDITRDPTDLPGPIGDRGPQDITLNLEMVELDGKLADGTTYRYMTFNGLVPGPMLRVRVDDTVTVNLKNMPGNFLIHSVDLHAVTGPGGGAQVMQVPPGQDA